MPWAPDEAPASSPSYSPSPSPSPSQPSLSNPLLIASVALVCIIFLLFSCMNALSRVYRALTTSRFTRHRVQRRLLVPDESNFVNYPCPQNQSYALESVVMHSLPISKFNKEEKDERRASNAECAVCLAEFEEGEVLRHLPNCSHAFHVCCIDTWFRSHSSCPICRSSAYDQTGKPDCSVSMFRILETLNREDYLHDRAAHYQMLRSEVLRNSLST